MSAIPSTANSAPNLPEIEPDWFHSTKEKLSGDAVRDGLLNYGLFGEKVPSCFVTVGLANIAMELIGGKLDEDDDKKLSKSIDASGHDYVRNESLRDVNIPRHLGIPHPECYAIQAIAIGKHWRRIAEHSNKPNPAISRVYVRDVGGGRIFELNYKGRERFQLEEDELQWMAGAHYLVEADIASCFPSIYTHCIPWALDGKVESKCNPNVTALVGNLLDKCTRNTRDRQTNGLLVGPHASNIVSEIILTRIDVELQSKGYTKVVRHVDDYKFYADTLERAEAFIRDLGLCLRAYEMTLNERKTQILGLPRPSDDNWRSELNRFVFPVEPEIRFSVIRSFLDLALECSQSAGKSTPLNYAIKTLAGGDEPRGLNARAKRMYSQEAMNLALAFPYLAPLLDEYVFTPYWTDCLLSRMTVFSTALVRIGIEKIYPDTIAHAIFLALKYDFPLEMDETEFEKVVTLDDCVANVLLLEYAERRDLSKVCKKLKKRASELKGGDAREADRQWLLIYRVWSTQELEGNGQGFLAKLKDRGFKFFAMPSPSTEAATTEVAPVQSQSGEHMAIPSAGEL